MHMYTIVILLKKISKNFRDCWMIVKWEKFVFKIFGCLIIIFFQTCLYLIFMIICLKYIQIFEEYLYFFPLVWEGKVLLMGDYGWIVL